MNEFYKEMRRDIFTEEEQALFKAQLKKANEEARKRTKSKGVHPRILQARKEGKNV